MYRPRSCPILDHCRIGSLEITPVCDAAYDRDHCRIGSLENVDADTQQEYKDHCRIGSLEKIK